MSRTTTSGIRSAVWFIPVMCVIAGVVLSLSTLAIDRTRDYEILPQWITGGPDAAIQILATIAASMVSLATLVLTITMVVVQLAMGQFSPRIVQTFLRDRPSQLAIGLFVATFAHAMLAMRDVSPPQGDGDAGQVPGLAIVVSYVLVLVSIAMLVMYVNHIGRSLRVSALIELVGDDTRKLLDEQYPDQLSTPQNDPQVVEAETSGVIIRIDHERLVALASQTNCRLHVVSALGSFVPAGASLLRIEGDPTGLDRDVARNAIKLGLERTMDEDVAYGFRMLVDMAERSLSDSPFLDPTTAVQAIDRLHDALRQLATRAFHDGTHVDSASTIRLTVPVMSWDAYVHLAFDEIRLAGTQSPQVTRRLSAALDDLIIVAPPERRRVLYDQLDLLRDAVRSSNRSAADIDVALTSDPQGLGTMHSPTESGRSKA